MANPKIEVEIGAVIDGLRKGFGESVKIIETLENQALELDKALKAATDLPEIQSLNARLAQTKAALSQLKNSGIDPLTKATSQYNSVGVDFARIIQDAPFGIIGVGNNITQLAGSFQTLKNTTGSTGAALKSAFASIFSSGNALILGISLLTTAFTILQQKGFFKTEDAAKSLSDRLNEYKETLDSVNQATLQGLTNSEKELQRFRELTAQAQNLNVSDKNRLAAVNELQKQYPNYLGNLTKEQILTGQVGDSYDQLTKQIIANAKAKAFSDEITKNTQDIRTLEKQQLDTTNKILAKRIQLEEAKAVSTTSAAKVSGQLAASDLGVSRLTSELNDLIQEQITSIGEANKIKQANLDLDVLINQELKNGAVFQKEAVVNTDKQIKANKELKRSFEEIQQVQFDRPAVSFEPTAPVLPGIDLNNIQSQVQGLESLNQALQSNGLNIQQFYAAIANGAAQGFSSLDAFITSLGETQAFINQTFAILEQGAENTLGDVAFSIGDALASGGNVIKAAGASLLGGLAGILNQLGQLAIATGLAVEGIKTALKTLNPAVAIGAGIALVALAGFVSNKAKSLGGSRGGGGGSSVGASGVGGGTSFIGGAQGGLFNQSRDLSGEFSIRGTDLVYVLEQANKKINKG
jgi:hypothetical protein